MKEPKNMKKGKNQNAKAILKKSLASLILVIFIVFAIIAIWKKDDFVEALKAVGLGNIGATETKAIELVSKPTGTLANGEKYIVCESIVQGIARLDLPNGNYTLTVVPQTSTGEGEIIEYPIELVNYRSNTRYSLSSGQSTRTVNLGNSTADQRMLIVKYWGDLTVDAGVTLTATTRKKGMYIHVNGTTTNNGTITMTAKGSYAKGENVYLYQNDNKTYEYVPASGADGLYSKNIYNTSQHGEKGTNGTNRRTGAGGRGGAISQNGRTTVLERTGSGTSYSGGAGTGGVTNSDGVTGATTHYQPGVNGLNGGVGTAYEKSYSAKNVSGGGAGISQGAEAKWNTGATLISNGNGTGGLLLLYSNNLSGTGKISSEGVQAPRYNWRANATYNYQAAGGSSGGGSVNIFINGENNFTGTTTAAGGATTTFPSNGAYNCIGGAGGDGTVTIYNKQMNFEKKDEFDFYEEFDTDAVYSKRYSYTGETQIFIAPIAGYYKLQTWGAQGGSALDGTGGKGGYSEGIVGLNKGDILYIGVGESGEEKNTGYNGGGYGHAPGGGATHISTRKNVLSELENYKSSVCIVAGGGGGGEKTVGGAGGGLIGQNGSKNYDYLTVAPTGGTQTRGGSAGASSNYGYGAGGSFGAGGSSRGANNIESGGGGGGGWYGGGGITFAGGGGGGSSYLSPILEKSKTIEGYKSVPTTYSDSSYMTGNSGNGYAKITLTEDYNCLNYEEKEIELQVKETKTIDRSKLSKDLINPLGTTYKNKLTDDLGASLGELIYRSLDENIATVTPEGVIRGVAEGRTKIRIIDKNALTDTYIYIYM